MEPKNDYALYIEKVFPQHSFVSVTRSIQRYPEKNPGFDKIVNEIIYEFEDVIEMIEE